MRSTLSLVIAAGLAMSLAGAAFAQAGAPKPSDEPLLKGPKVDGGSVPGEQRQFAPGRMRGKDMMGTEIPHRGFMRALDALRGESAGEGVRLTSKQNAEIREINEAFVASLSEYRKAHMEEARSLMAQLSPQDRQRAMEFLGRMGENRRPELDRRKNTPKKDAGKEMEGSPDPQKGEQARERLKQLLAGAPSPADTHARIFGVLNDAQKKAFTAELDKLRQEMGPRGTDSAKSPAKPDSIDGANLPPRARERLKNLPPEQREEALRRFKDRRGKDGGKGQDKKPPSTRKDVEVPKPD